MSIWTRPFWKATAERAVKTVAQAAVAVLTADVSGLLEVDWAQTASIAGLAGLVSVLTSVASGADGTGPSAIGAETLPTER